VARRAAALAVALVLLGGGAGAAPDARPTGLGVTFTPPQARPGDLILIHVTGAPLDLLGEWGGQPLRFFPVRDGVAALSGVPLDAPARAIPWRLSRPRVGGGRVVVGAGSLPVRSWAYETQHLTLPPGQVDLDAATLARVRAQQAELRAALAGGAGERLWRGAFRQPVDGGRATGGFGLRRIINGQTRSPHAGYDWAALRGTPVLAAATGRVALVAEHFFAGRLVVLDHGLGLATLYFHLDEAMVASGEAVERGARIGSVGASGRATGPHLHLGVSIHGALVDPMVLLSLPLLPGDESGASRAASPPPR